MHCLARFALIVSLVPVSLLAEEATFGAGITEEAYGYDWQGDFPRGLGNDFAFAHRGLDLVFGGAGPDQFVIDTGGRAPDGIRVLPWKKADTARLGSREIPRSRSRRKIEIENIQIDYDGDIAMRLINEEQFEVARIWRSDLTLKIDDLGDDIRLIFTKKLGGK